MNPINRMILRGRGSLESRHSSATAGPLRQVGERAQRVALRAGFAVFLRSLVLLATLLSAANVSRAQSSSLYQQVPQAGYAAPTMLNDSSWTYTPTPPPKQIRRHDIVVVRVDEVTRTTSDGEMERRKDAQYNSVLLDWVRLVGLKAIKPSPQADGDPRIRGQLQQLYRAESELETRESLAFNIACSVADIRPNGTLVLEAHRQIRINDESWEVSLSGVCRADDIGPDNVVLSRNIMGLKIDKRERGHVRDGYKRGWFLRWFDEFHPF